MYSFQILYTIPFAFSQKLKKKKKKNDSDFKIKRNQFQC